MSDLAGTIAKLREMHEVARHCRLLAGDDWQIEYTQARLEALRVAIAELEALAWCQYHEQVIDLHREWIAVLDGMDERATELGQGPTLAAAVAQARGVK